jgi:hypothetical protein
LLPSGKTCTIAPGVQIGGSVIVSSGATLTDNGAQIADDIQATSPKGIGLAGSASGPGSVGIDVEITGVSGSGPGTIVKGSNYICDTEIGHDLQITGSRSKAGPWIIGDQRSGEECGRGGNQIGTDMQVVNNANSVDISDNMKGSPPTSNVGIGHDLQETGNAVTSTSPVVANNYIGYDAECEAHTKGTSNIVGHNNEGCP